LNLLCYFTVLTAGRFFSLSTEGMLSVQHGIVTITSLEVYESEKCCKALKNYRIYVARRIESEMALRKTIENIERSFLEKKYWNWQEEHVKKDKRFSEDIRRSARDLQKGQAGNGLRSGTMPMCSVSVAAFCNPGRRSAYFGRYLDRKFGSRRHLMDTHLHDTRRCIRNL